MTAIKQLQVHIATFSKADLIFDCFTGDGKIVLKTSP